MHSWNNKGSCVEAASYPRHITRSFKHPHYELKNHSYSPSFSVRKVSCFPTFPLQCSALSIFLLISSSSRGQAGERRRGIYYSRWSRVFWTCQGKFSGLLGATKVSLSKFYFCLCVYIRWYQFSVSLLSRNSTFASGKQNEDTWNSEKACSEAIIPSHPQVKSWVSREGREVSVCWSWWQHVEIKSTHWTK